MGRALLGLSRELFRAGDRVCVAVSGGADSVALLVALAEQRAEIGVGLSAAHVHHGLRGEEADGDEAFVRSLCERLAVPLTVFRVDTVSRQAAEGEGLEEAARELRYAALRGLMESGAVDVVATAHTLDDQAETVMMKLLRGAWTEGLGGISPVVEGSGLAAASEAGLSTALRSGRDDTFVGGAGEKRVVRFAQDDNFKKSGKLGRIVRPMLRVRRSEVEAFLRERGQDWREDA